MRPKGSVLLPGGAPAPEALKDKDLAKALCSAGPKHCEGCEVQCGYGREYIRRRARRN